MFRARQLEQDVPQTRRSRPRLDEARFIDQRALRRRVREDLSTIRIEDALHRRRILAGRVTHQRWLVTAEQTLSGPLGAQEFESLLNEWRRRRRFFVNDRSNRDAMRLFPLVLRSTPSPRRGWLQRIAVRAPE